MEIPRIVLRRRCRTDKGATRIMNYASAKLLWLWNMLLDRINAIGFLIRSNYL